MKNRPTGIIRTLPGQAKTYEFGQGRDRMMRSYAALQDGLIDTILIALSQMPKVDVLHLYVLVGGEIVCRMNIVEYQNGKDFELKCWDGEVRTSNYWAVCSAPVEYPPEPIKMRGFQGFRYTEGLW